MQGLVTLSSTVGSDVNQLKPLSALLDQRMLVRWYAPLMAGNAIVLIVFRRSGGDTWRLMAFSRADSSLMWDIVLPGMPALNGLAMDRAGDIVAPLIDGKVVCVGEGGNGTLSLKTEKQ